MDKKTNFKKIALTQKTHISLYEAEKAHTHDEQYEVARQTLQAMAPAISIYGSARIATDDPYYSVTVQLAKRLSADGYSIISGGGPGIMEAANKGAQQGGSPSIGLNIKLPHEQLPNPYQDILIYFHDFYLRKNTFIEHSKAFVIMPGGFGTMDEIFETITLMQTNKRPRFPIIFFGTAFWAGLFEWIKEILLTKKLISQEDLDHLFLTDDIEEVIQYIKGK